MDLDIHKDIKGTLENFIETKQIPNIIFHGPNGSGKLTIVNDFINRVFNNDKELLKNYLMHVNCAHGKGIKFVREDLKFFAKTHINSDNKFKIIVMTNADYLTIDAQSALRRCIELFSHTTKFFFIVQNKYKLLKPILSRFSEIYIPEPIINNNKINLHKYKIEESFPFYKSITQKRINYLKNYIKNLKEINYKILIDVVINLYEKGYTCLDIIKYVEYSSMTDEKKSQLLLTFNKIKYEFRCEKILMLFLLNFILIRSDYNLENIIFM